jgi:hypothetical protein
MATITVTQVNQASKTNAHKVTNPVISPAVASSVSAKKQLTEGPVDGEMHEYLFRVEKNGKVFWVGAAVPKGTTNFTQTQVYFHPTVVNGKNVHAREEDYATFTGGWSKSIQRYVALQGGQLAAAGKLVPLLVPFTAMSALNPKQPDNNVFGTQPEDTLVAILFALQKEVTGSAPSSPLKLSQVGAASFSSGIGALRLFINSMSKSGLVKEVLDFDSRFIVAERSLPLVRASGAKNRWFTQTAAATAVTADYILIPDTCFSGITRFPISHAHACIGWMMYYSAMTNSVIK